MQQKSDFGFPLVTDLLLILILIGWCKKHVNPLLTHWSYVFLALTHWWGHLLQLPYQHINGLVQERRNSIANTLELRLSCTNPSISLLPCTYPWVACWHQWSKVFSRFVCEGSAIMPFISSFTWNKNTAIHSLSTPPHVDGLMQERLNSIANALELRLTCINPLLSAMP